VEITKGVKLLRTIRRVALIGLGAVIEPGKEYGVPTPVNETLHRFNRREGKGGAAG